MSYMNMNAYDAGSSYLVRAENLDAAYEWLKDKGEYAYRVGVVRDCVILSADGCAEMFCGRVSNTIGRLVVQFLERFCEPGSYACQHIEDFNEYRLYWKDGDGVHEECRAVENPFAGKIIELESEDESWA